MICYMEKTKLHKCSKHLTITYAYCVTESNLVVSPPHYCQKIYNLMFKHNDFSVIHTGKLIIKEFLFVDIVYP